MSARDEKILAGIAALARDELDHRGEVRPAMRLVEDLGLDSIRLMTLAIAVEDHFRIRLEEDEEESIVTVADLVAIVARKATEGAA